MITFQRNSIYSISTCFENEKYRKPIERADEILWRQFDGVVLISGVAISPERESVLKLDK